MVKLFAEIDEKFQKLFEDGYIARDGFYIKAKGKNYDVTTAVKENKPEIEFHFKHRHTFNDIRVKKDFTLRSSGNNTIESKACLGKFINKTWVRQALNWNSTVCNFDYLFSLNSRYYKPLYARLDFHYFKGGEWILTPHFGYRLCDVNSIVGDISFDGKKREFNCLNIGWRMKPNKNVESLISRQYNGQVGKGTDFLWGGLLSLSSRLKVKDNSRLGFDYVYNFDTKIAAMEIGFETKHNKDITLKGRVNSGGDIETSAKIAISDKWNFTIAIGTNAGDVAGKQQPLIGVGFEGKI